MGSLVAPADLRPLSNLADINDILEGALGRPRVNNIYRENRFLMPDDVKEVAMDVAVTGSKKRRRRTRKETTSTVEKDHAEPVKVTSHEPKPITGQPVSARPVILAPARTKVSKVLLIPKGATKPKPMHRKTFKAKRVHVVIDNTKKTQTRRNKVVADIDSMSEETLRAAAVSAKLSKAETVAKVPLPLLRQLMKDYRMMRGQLV